MSTLTPNLSLVKPDPVTDLVLVSQINDNMDKIDANGNGPWVAYAPTWTAAITNPVIGNGTITGFYRMVGNTFQYRIVITMGSTTTYGSGMYLLSTPSNTKNPTHIAGYGIGYNLVNRKTLMAYWASTALIRLIRCSTDVEVDQTGLGIAWAAGHVLSVEGFYEKP